MPTYDAKPPLAFADLPYQGLDGKPWPVSRADVADVRKRYKLGKNVRVAYVDLHQNGGRTLVFLHGLGSYLKFWRYQLDTFARGGYRVLAIDMLGYGKSDKPATFPYTMESMVDVVRSLLRQLDVKDPILVGHSMGGQIALSYAIRYPKEVSALVLTAPAGFEEFGSGERRWLTRVFTVPLVAGASEYDIWGSVRYNNFYNWDDEYNWLIEERVRLAKNPEFASYAYANVKSVRGLANNDFVRKNLGKVKAPTLIVHGDRDRLIPNPFMHGGTTRSIMEYGHENIRGSTLVTLEGCGHMVQMDCSAEYNATVRGFLRRRSALDRRVSNR